MPELPPEKPRPNVATPSPVVQKTVPYAELRCKSNYSFLEGASHPEELVAQAHALGYRAITIADRNSLGGVVRAHVAAKKVGIKLLIGAELTPTDSLPVVLLARNRAGYTSLARLITVGCRRTVKGSCLIHFADLSQHAEGIFACVITSPAKDEHGFDQPPLPKTSLKRALQKYRDVFQEYCAVLVSRHLGPRDLETTDMVLSLADQLTVPVAACNDVHYHEPSRQRLQDIVTAIRYGLPVTELGRRRFPNAERYLKPMPMLERLFAACPKLLAQTVTIAEQCHFSLDELRYEYPGEACPADKTPFKFLEDLSWEGVKKRYPHGGVPHKVIDLLRKELALVEELHYENYFLTVWDLVSFARGRGILCQGRGSAGNSVVCYALGVTEVDPCQVNLLFERFISRERNEAPDIDIDFEHERREEVLQYIYEKYSRDHAAMTAEVICYRPKSAARDIAKALGFSLDRVDKLAGNLDHYHHADAPFAERFREAGVEPESRLGKLLLELVIEIQNFPRHFGQHVGGMVLTKAPLPELVPVENAAMPDRTILQWDKDDLDAMSILKVDCLGLGMLTCIRKCFAMLEKYYRRPMTLATVPKEDPGVYTMLSRADSIGVFQVESRAQMSMLPRLKPKCFFDLVIEVALVRPGPIQGQMVHPYLRRRSGLEPIEYPDERIREVLASTLGVPIFQEQAMQIAMVAGGFTGGEADQLRKAMAAWKKKGGLAPFQKKLFEGMTANGYTVDFANRMIRQIQGFGDYGFPLAHAAAFANLVYVSAWLKRYYPAAFTASLLNSLPMGFYQPSQLVQDVCRHGVTVLPPDINFSDWDSTLEPARSKNSTSNSARDGCEPIANSTSQGEQPSSYALRLGLREINGFAQAAAERIMTARARGTFCTMDELGRRAKLARHELMLLARADACKSLGTDRRSALWHALPRTDPFT